MRALQFTDKTEMKKKLGVGLTFHDESPSSPSLKFASVPSEFDQKASDLGEMIYRKQIRNLDGYFVR